MAGLGVLAAPSFAGADPAAATHRQSPQSQTEADAGMQRMHELMVSENPGMQRMHELMVSENPGMQRMHELMHVSPR